MGRSSSRQDSLAQDAPLLFEAGALPLAPSPIEKNFRSLQHPVWTEEKARLIQEYLRLFTFITKHGNCIDGFAAPQRRELSEICSAALVLNTEPRWIRNFWLCDIDGRGVDLLRGIAREHEEPKRKIQVLPGDFNQTVGDVLASKKITTKTATFALLDQRTFECDWSTVAKIAGHKPSLGATDTKIEIFYFLATGWLDRSIAAVRRDATAQRLTSWWGRDDWRSLQGMAGIPRAKLLSERFRDELGYAYARPYAIHNRKRDGRIMYHMIHATDHDEAAQLMLRAYRKVSGRADFELPARQSDMDELWREATGEVGGDEC